MVITKSKYVEFMKCQRLPYLNEYKSGEAIISEYTQQLAKEGTLVGAIGRAYFGDYVLVDKEDKVGQTNSYLEAGERIIAEASFRYKDLFCAVDLLKVDDDGVEIYELKSRSSMSESFIDDISFQTYVLRKLGYKIKGSYVLHIDKDYILKDELNLKELFKLVKVDVLDNVEANLEYMRNKCDELSELEASNNCKECPFFNYCFSHLPKNNIFKLAGLTKAYDKYNDGCITYEDYLQLPKPKSLKTYNKIIEQIEFELQDLPQKVLKNELNSFLQELEYPLYYLDFETIRKAIPKYKGFKTNQEIVIQYSLHIQNSNGELSHKEYLLTDEYDNREEVSKRLIEDLGDKGSIIVYHKDMESGKISQLADMLPEYKENLEALNKRMVDLEIPFKNRVVYNKKMYGKSSIKYVLPALCEDYEEAYKSLSLVHNGTEAMAYFDKMLESKGEEKQIYIKALLEYCCLDTMAMVAIVNKLYELVKVEH